MPNVISLIPRGGINRLPVTNDSSPGTPFDLHNCRVFTDTVRPVTAGTNIAVPGGLEDGGGFPMFRHNDQYITGCSKGVIGEALDAGDGIKSGAWHNGYLYASKCGCTGDNCDQMGVAVYSPEFPASPAETLPPRIISAEIAGELDPTDPGQSDETYEEGVGAGKFVSYLLIPKNSRGEAGEWAYAWYYNENATTKVPQLRVVVAPEEDTFVEVYRTVELDYDTSRDSNPAAGGSDICEPRQYYRISELSKGSCDEAEEFCDVIDIDPLWALTDPPLDLNDMIAPDPSDSVLRLPIAFGNAFSQNSYSVLRVTQAGHPLEGEEFRVVEFGGIDTSTWFKLDNGVATGIDRTLRYIDIDPGGYNLLDFIGTEVTICRLVSASPDGFSWGLIDRSKIRMYKRGAEAEAPGIPESATTLDRRPNAHVYRNWLAGRLTGDRIGLAPPLGPATPVEYRGPCANAMHNDGGVMLYGGVMWPTRQPKISFAHAGLSGAGTTTFVRLVYEYLEKGQTVYGPPIDVPAAQRLNVEYGGGEVGLLVFVWDDARGDYFLWERIGLGETDLAFYAGACEECFTYDAAAFSPDLLTDQPWADYAPDVKNCVRENNAIFMSESLRPWETSFDQARVDSTEEEVRLIAPARLDERESLASYSMYVGTNRGVYYARRDGRLLFLDRITPLTGVAEGRDGQALWVTTHFGGAFIGTDGHLWYTSGRDMVRLSRTVLESPGKGDFYPDLWTRVFSMAYHTRFRELWVATNTGLWVFDMGDLNPANRQGVVAHYNGVDILGEDVIRVWFDREDNAGLIGTSALGNILVKGDTTDPVALTGAGNYLPDPSVSFSRFGGGSQRLNLDWVSADYDPMPASRVPGNSGAGSNYGRVTLDARSRIMQDTLVNASLALAAIPGVQDLPRFEPGSRRYPRISGTGFRITFTDFEELRQLDLQVSGLSRNL